jgi:methionine-rich copper-binding protein CopC
MRNAFLLTAAVVVLTAGHADAHARLLHASPKVGETVARPPTELRLWFSESIEPRESSVTLAGPGGRAIATGRLLLDPQDKRVVVVALPAALLPGPYRVSWQVTSVDTHRTDGDFMFRVGP